MSGNNKIVWDQPHETTEEGEREARGGWGKAGVSDSSLCACLPHTPPPSKIFFSELSQSEDAWLHTEEMSAKAKERGKLQMTATFMRSPWLHVAETVSGSTWLPITVNRCVQGLEKQRFCPEVQPVGIYCIKSYEGKGPLHNLTVINDTEALNCSVAGIQCKLPSVETVMRLSCTLILQNYTICTILWTMYLVLQLEKLCVYWIVCVREQVICWCSSLMNSVPQITLSGVPNC